MSDPPDRVTEFHWDQQQPGENSKPMSTAVRLLLDLLEPALDQMYSFTGKESMRLSTMTIYGSSHQQPSVEDVLSGPSGSGVPAFKFPQGQSPVTFKGIVIDQEAQQQREYMPDGGIGKPLFWDDGKPKMQVVVTAKQEGTNDEYRLYMRGQALSAARQALANAGAKSFEPGGTIVMAYVRDEKLKSGYKSKFFEIEYIAADKAAASVSDVLGTEDVAPAAPAATPEEPAQQVSIDPQTLSPDALDALKRAGLLGS